MERAEIGFEAINHQAAEYFLSQHDPSPETFNEYAAAQIAKIQDGETTWMVRNVDTNGRAYDLYCGTRGVAATVLHDAGELGIEEYEMFVSDEAAQEQLNQRLADVRLHYGQMGKTAHDVELQVLAEAIEAATAHANSLLQTSH